MLPSSKQPYYYVPEESTSPLLGTVALFSMAMGATFLFNSMPWGWPLLSLGLVLIGIMMWLWFGDVIKEGLRGLNSKRVCVSFRWGMGWFIFSEVMFFLVLFFALFYVRLVALPDLSTAEADSYLWDWYGTDFAGHWPVVGAKYILPFSPVSAFGIPAINTAVLLMSGATLTLSHNALCDEDMTPALFWLAFTVFLGVVFVGSQALEYHHAVADGLLLSSGVYGSIFYLLTGFHGFHVSIGCIMLFVVWFRMYKGHLTATNHFSFEAIAWYWHFVDVVWLILFVFVYWM
ncbi:cytochrome c oxidase subunit 3 [Candidatus Ichthyocystis hellenicum]|uniref:cytochrome c oxidase subunit 3 n=1 Tax=Candidatus Ichthyocystis hellenicum TaxID=1561003 RepID=UPI000AE1ACEE|nr:cytochrome c oxidase subunit 3 [Candidatus Ichthyocystis hellenicum]